MLEDVYKTLSVIVDGPEKEEDEQVLDLVLFDTMDAFDEAVSELEKELEEESQAADGNEEINEVEVIE